MFVEDSSHTYSYEGPSDGEHCQDDAQSVVPGQELHRLGEAAVLLGVGPELRRAANTVQRVLNIRKTYLEPNIKKNSKGLRKIIINEGCPQYCV